MDMMRAVWNVPGDSGGWVEVREVPRPSPQSHEVLVKVHASAINRGEILAIRQLRSGAGGIGGIEFAGEVVEAGSAVSGWRAGDAVMGHGRGAQAAYVCVDARRLMRKPERLDWAQAAAFVNVFITAHDAMITNGGLQRGETVLVNAASSGVGMAAIQIARWAGAGRVIATSGSAVKLDRLMPLGITHPVVVDGDGQWVEAVKAASAPDGVHLLVDCVGGSVIEHNLKVMALDGRLVSVGRLGGNSGPLDLDFLALRRLHLIGVTFRTRTEAQTIACFQACARDLLEPLERGVLEPIVDRVFPLEDIAAAHQWMLGNAQVGKIILQVR